MFNQPWLIRVCSGALESWFSDKAESSLPAVFRHSETEHSTYEVDSDVDEALAIAAHQLTKPQQKLDTQCALRIRLLDIEASSIPVSRRQLGETGVISVDHWHRDLIGDRGTMTRLTSLVRERSLNGEDRIRRLNKYQLQLMIARICEKEVGERPTHTAERCELLLGRRSELTADRELAVRELALARIPESAVRPVAYELYQSGGSKLGLPNRDWFDALVRLRDRYTIHYMAAQFVKA
ncbi:MAG: hypothetical protein ACLQIB_01420 [Isosphaeraceae bacterium]